jgi:hypothetical protein
MVESPLREKCVEKGIMNSLRGSIELCGDFRKRASRGADRWAILDKAKAGCLWVSTTQSPTEQ